MRTEVALICWTDAESAVRVVGRTADREIVAQVRDHLLAHAGAVRGFELGRPQVTRLAGTDEESAKDSGSGSSPAGVSR